MRVSDLTEEQLKDLSIIERSASALSLVGCMGVFLTFVFCTQFRKPVNRLVFLASLGNIVTNVATMIARNYVHDPLGASCQTQAFLIQMFMPADACWTLAMAVNVYLTFYRKYDATDLRKMEKWYILLCYGVPFIPALVLIFVTAGRGHVYGDATLWCWIGPNWESLRVGIFYGPVCVIVFLTMIIYARAGSDIWQKRQLLRTYQRPETGSSVPLNPLVSAKTTEVTVVHEAVNSRLDHESSSRDFRSGDSSGKDLRRDAYQVEVSCDFNDLQAARNRWSLIDCDGGRPPTTAGVKASQIQEHPYPYRQSQEVIVIDAAWSYTKVSILFFFAMLVTWVPSAANRLYSFAHPGDISLFLQYTSAFVLPLQGFWNAMIYFYTSSRAIKPAWDDLINLRIRLHNPFKTVPAQYISDYSQHNRLSMRTSVKQSTDTESTRGLTSVASRMARAESHSSAV